MTPVSDLTSFSKSVAKETGGAGAIWAGVGLAALLLATITNWLAYFPPLQDFGDWIYQGYLTKLLLSGISGPALLKRWPVPNALSQFTLAWMMTLLSPITAGKLFATLYLIAAGSAMWLLSRRTGGGIDGLRFLLLISLGVVHAPYWTGEINYQIGLLIVAVFIFYDAKASNDNMLLDTALSIALFFCHAVCLGIFLIYIGWRSLLRGRITQGIVTVLPAVTLILWYLVADERPRTHYDSNNPGSVGPVLSGIAQNIGYRLYVLAKIGPYQNLVFDGGGDFTRLPPLYWIGVAVNFFFAACMGIFYAQWVVRSVVRRLITPEFLTSLSCAVLAIINPGLISPVLTNGIGNIAERLIYPALVIAVLFYDRSVWLARIAGVTSGFLVVFLVYALIVLPHGPSRGEVPGWGAMNDPKARYHILFWHRPFIYLPQVEAAQAAAVSGKAPTVWIAYETSILESN